MHGQFQHTPATTKWAMTNQLSGRHLGAFFYWTRFIRQYCAVREYHSNLADQSAMGIRVRIRVRGRISLFLHFSQRISKTSTLSSANFTEGNILLIERTQTINKLQQQNNIEYVILFCCWLLISITEWYEVPWKKHLLAYLLQLSACQSAVVNSLWPLQWGWYH